MTNIRAKGFDSKLELGEELSELEDSLELQPLSRSASDQPESDADLREVAWLRRDVADMRERLMAGRSRAERFDRGRASWLRIRLITALGATLLLGVALRRARFTKLPFPRD